ncbi:hypothetical protein PPACK8108_LOCUS23044 [Phakopsora pachyrhizi]|uniref:PPPDE domain-containing protein n=1 Tax=Phakopsora pachyrhizi TaxID=170000 RepID=A0AAV0BNP2_PHAPC|nr:hypothetical protein PPACK8108_LOCUS23044 [Phakopsora pachyrhizi]
MQSPSSSSSSSTDPSLRPVHLYVYDLSNGLARSMSMSWTGRQFDGIMTSRPGNSHIGKPLRVIDQGETMIDPVTFEDYIKGLRSSWNAQLFMSHSLELSSLRNCNNFSKEGLSFLNGSDVPDYILRLRSFQSSSNPPTTPIGLLSNLTSTIHNNSNNNSNLSKGSGPRSVTSLEAFTSELQHIVCVVVNFTNKSGCPPCRTIAPVYRDLSSKFSTNNLSTRHSVNSNIKKPSRKPSREITFLVVDTTISNEICLKFQIRATLSPIVTNYKISFI